MRTLRWQHVRRVAWAACLYGALIPGRVRGEGKPADVPPEFVAKMTEFLKKVAQAQRKHLDARMSTEIGEVTKATGLGPDGVKSLEAAAAKAEDAAQAEMTAKAVELLPEQYTKGGWQSSTQFNSPEVIEMVANEDTGVSMGVHYTEALDQPAWKDALAHTLSAEQAAAWQKVVAERDGTALKEISTYLDAKADQLRESKEEPMRNKGHEIIAGLNLPKDRADQIVALEKKAVDASLEAWRKTMTKTLLNDGAAKRKRILESQGFYSVFEEGDAPEQQAVWKDGLIKLLSDDDRARLKAAQDSHRGRRVHALGQVMTQVLDEKIAFTASQRTRLEPVMERLVQLQSDLFPGSDDGNYYNFNAQSFFKPAANVRPEEVRPILDDIQWKHWQELGHRKTPKSSGDDDDDEEQTPPAPTPKPVSNEAGTFREPEDLERAVADFMLIRAAIHHEDGDAVMLLQAEDATRVASLPEPAAARLRTAARGTAEATVALWASSMEPNIRAQVQNATPENIQQLIANADRYLYERIDTKNQTLWKAAVNSEMTAPQQAVWQVERDARDRFADAAIGQFLVAEFDRKFSLTPEQWDKLVPAVSKAFTDYRPEISQMFSSFGTTTPWYLNSFYMFLPLQAVPESDFKAILGSEEWDLWKGSSECSNSANYWENIKSNHDRRTKEKPKK